MTSGYWTGIDTDGAALAAGPDVGGHEHQIETLTSSVPSNKVVM
jgi:hypothetical protein